jgi:twitching motility two-component system response regulator PilG
VEAYPSFPWYRSGIEHFPDGELNNSPSEKSLLESGWFVFFVHGQIAYAAEGNNTNLSRLRDYLHRYKLQDSLTQLLNEGIETSNVPEYSCIWQLLEKHILTTVQGRSIIQSMIEETLFDLLSLHQGSFIFEIGSALAPQLITVATAPLVTNMIKEVQQWKQFHPQISSPNQCPIINDNQKLSENLAENAYKHLYRWADGTTSLRQISRYLNRNVFTIAKAIYPYVQKGWIQLVSASPSVSKTLTQGLDLTQTNKIRPVVCIDDDLVIGKSVEYTLKPQGYQITIISDPLEALSQIFQMKPKPALILCDIAMPKLDGYELCAMLRRSTAFRQTPIIMLTGKEGFIDRVRARMVGATDYLTKPFGESELLMLLEKYLV